jgi:hypothetical protein
VREWSGAADSLVHSYCMKGDPVCNFGNPPAAAACGEKSDCAHLQYMNAHLPGSTLTYSRGAGAFLWSRIQATTPAPAPTPTPSSPAPALVFDGSPGTGATPATLGQYTMPPFTADPTEEGTDETQLTGPTGTISFDTALQHDLVGDGWQTWSNGYTSDVYEDDDQLVDGSFEITVTLPPGTGAFYAYAEPAIGEFGIAPGC